MNPNFLIHIFAFGVLTLAWLAFAAALVFNQGMLDAAWQAFRAMPLILQTVVGVVFLPFVLGLWIWEADWHIAIRFVFATGLGIATIYTFVPKPV